MHLLTGGNFARDHMFCLLQCTISESKKETLQAPKNPEKQLAIYVEGGRSHIGCYVM